MDPYKILGIKKDADGKAIKAAYRRQSAVHHPDKAGGDTEKFQQVKLAYDVLSDPGRKARYDSTGRVDEVRATSEKIKAFIEVTLRSVVEASRPDGSSEDPVFDNIRDKMLMSLVGARVEVKNNIFKTQRKIERAQRLAERFKTAESFDPVGDSLKKEKDRLQQELHTHQDALELSIEVEKVMKTYSYEVGPGLEGQFSPGPTPRPAGGYRLTSARRSGPRFQE